MFVALQSRTNFDQLLTNFLIRLPHVFVLFFSPAARLHCAHEGINEGATLKKKKKVMEVCSLKENNLVFMCVTTP